MNADRKAPRPATPARMVVRGMMRRCAVCGGGDIFFHWFKMRERCPRCGYRFARESGFYLGSWLLNLAVTEVLLACLGIIPLIAILNADPDASLVPVYVGVVAAGLIGPVVLYPHSRTVWVALELILRPVDEHDPYDRD